MAVFDCHWSPTCDRGLHLKLCSTLKISWSHSNFKTVFMNVSSICNATGNNLLFQSICFFCEFTLIYRYIILYINQSARRLLFEIEYRPRLSCICGINQTIYTNHTEIRENGINGLTIFDCHVGTFIHFEIYRKGHCRTETVVLSTISSGITFLRAIRYCMFLACYFML
jgi:hypothetical protein